MRDGAAGAWADRVARVREALLAAGYTADGVPALLGPVAQAALARHETVPARRASTGGTPLDTLVRLFLLQLPVPERAAAAALPVEDARGLGLVDRDGDRVRATLDLRPYGEASRPGPADPHQSGHPHQPGHPHRRADTDRPARAEPPAWWVVSDLGTGLDGRHVPLRPDHVLGVGGASTTLAQITVREPVGRTLDVGTGSGVQALHASRHSDQVVGTDLSGRACDLARLTAALSGVPVDVRQGDLLDPVAGEEFDLVVSNPPFVIGPAARHTYRDSGHHLDGVCARLVHDAPALLRPGGTLQLLASWVHLPGRPWDERVAGWFPAHGVRALVLQREVQDVAEYVETWLRDSGEAGSPGYLQRYDEWLAALEAEGVEAVGFGYVTLRRTDEDRQVTATDWPHPVEQPLGPHLHRWLQRQDWLARHDDAGLLASTLRLAPDVVQEQLGAPGAEDPEAVVLRQQVGLRRAFQAGTGTAALAGACDGTLPLGALVDAVLTVVPDERERLVADARALVAMGLLEPVDGPGRAGPPGTPGGGLTV